MTDATHTTGSCLCGDVRLRAALPSKWVAHCHCHYCRKAHGAPFVTWAGFHDAAVTVEDPQGRLHWYTSSPGAQRGSCSRCGTPMLFTSSRWPGETHLARALLDEAVDKLPAAHVFYESHVSWLEVADALPKKRSTG
jgi:hypothetical protein